MPKRFAKDTRTLPAPERPLLLEPNGRKTTMKVSRCPNSASTKTRQQLRGPTLPKPHRIPQECFQKPRFRGCNPQRPCFINAHLEIRPRSSSTGAVELSIPVFVAMAISLPLLDHRSNAIWCRSKGRAQEKIGRICIPREDGSQPDTSRRSKYL